MYPLKADFVVLLAPLMPAEYDGRAGAQRDRRRCRRGESRSSEEAHKIARGLSLLKRRYNQPESDQTENDGEAADYPIAVDVLG